MSAVAARIEHPCKVVLTLRGLALLATLLSSVALADGLPTLTWAIVLSSMVSLAMVARWDRFAVAILRHPIYLTAELAVGLLALSATGIDSPFFLFTLGTAALGGLFYGRTGAVLCSVPLVLGYLAIYSGETTTQGGFLLSVGMPVLYVLVAATAAAARVLLDREHVAREGIAVAEALAAAESERARLAREMHDSLGKMLYGLAMSAMVLAERGGGESAHRLAVDARAAAERARELVSDLREELPGPAELELERRAREWASRGGFDLRFSATGAGTVGQMVARELIAILDEALANVVQHARAQVVVVGVTFEEAGLRLAIEDDGIGFAGREDEPGHYGVRGMRERARLAGGSAAVDSRVGSGTSITVLVPAAVEDSAGAPPPLVRAPALRGVVA